MELDVDYKDCLEGFNRGCLPSLKLNSIRKRELFKTASKEDNLKDEKTKKGFWHWLVQGTISEPWPTKEEFLNNPKVQEEIRKVRELFPKEKEK